MTKERFILAVDQGTSSSRSIVFDKHSNIVASHQVEVPTIHLRDGWAEQNPEDIWDTTVQSIGKTLEKVDKLGGEVAAIGIANQRETTLLWDRRTGVPIYNAILWHDRRTAGTCRKLIADGWENTIQQKTGLLLDPYFSATKISWILNNVDGSRVKSERGSSIFGTVDSFLLWRLTGGAIHATDATNASRTSLFNIHQCRWDEELLQLFQIPSNCLPSVFDSSHYFGETDPSLFGRKIPILGIIGDQQASALGHGCVDAGSAKSTYGTGCFLMINTGSLALRSSNRLLTTIAYKIGGSTSYATEGSIFVAGEAVKWLRDGLEIISEANEVEHLAESGPESDDLYLVPAFSGLGAPHWNPHVRGALYGITGTTARTELARAVLDASCYQTSDILGAAHKDGNQVRRLRVDGGMSANNWFLQRLSDILDISVERPKLTETTAWGAAFLAGLGLRDSFFSSLAEIKSISTTDSKFIPSMTEERRSKLLNGWDIAVQRTLATF